METYWRFFDARSQARHPLYARLDGRGCWLTHKPSPCVIESVSFQAILHNGHSDNLTRSIELGKIDQYYCTARHGVGDGGIVSLYSSEQQARRDYEDAVKRHDGDSRWERVPGYPGPNGAGR
jgi:hypothetical protein